MEERVYNEQLDLFLADFEIEKHEIPAFGAAKKTALYNNGIRTAADISKLGVIKVPGIGPKNQQVLLSWQRQMGDGFVYIPDNNKLALGLQDVTSELSKIRGNLEHLIRKEYQALNHLKLNIANRASVLERQIDDLSVRNQQAKIDLAAFRKLAA